LEWNELSILRLLRRIALAAILESETKKEYKKMNTSFLTKHLSKLTLAINLTITILIWFWCIGTTIPTSFDTAAYTFLPADTIKIIITIIFVMDNQKHNSI
jgi:hypothetical protein